MQSSDLGNLILLDTLLLQSFLSDDGISFYLHQSLVQHEDLPQFSVYGHQIHRADDRRYRRDVRGAVRWQLEETFKFTGSTQGRDRALHNPERLPLK